MNKEKEYQKFKKKLLKLMIKTACIGAESVDPSIVSLYFDTRVDAATTSKKMRALKKFNKFVYKQCQICGVSCIPQVGTDKNSIPIIQYCNRLSQEEEILFEYDFCEMDLTTRVMLRKYNISVKYVQAIRFKLVTAENQILIEDTEEDFDF